MGGVKDQIMRLFKNEGYSKPKRVKAVYGSGKEPNKLRRQKKSEVIIKSIRKLLQLKNENEAIKDRNN